MITRLGCQVSKFVFALRAVSGALDTKNEPEVRFELRAGTLSPATALTILIEIMNKNGGATSLSYDSEVIPVSQVSRRFRGSAAWGQLETEVMSFQYGVVASFEHCFLQIEEKHPGAAGQWDAWVRPFLKENGFVQGWISDAEYCKWENATDPLDYKLAGRDFSHARMKSNGLPPPLERQIIDISANPGRSVLRNGYVEAVASRMWLSDLFWAKVGFERKRGVQEEYNDYIRYEDLDLMELTLPDDCFVSEATAKEQNRLRFVLYGPSNV